MNSEYEKKQLEVQAANAKAQFNYEMSLNAEYMKQMIREEFSEKKKAQYDEVIICDTGEFEIITRNLTLDAKSRKLCNFSNPEMIKLYNKKNSNEVLMLKINIGAKKFSVFLAVKEANNPKYLSKKFSEVGCEIYASNRRLREEYLHKIVICVINRTSETNCIPDKRGWNRNSDGTFKFAGPDSPIWKEVLEWAK